MEFRVLFSNYLALFTSIAPFFVPKDPLGPDNGPKQNFKTNLKTCLTPAQCIWFPSCFDSCMFCFVIFGGPRPEQNNKKLVCKVMGADFNRRCKFKWVVNRYLLVVICFWWFLVGFNWFLIVFSGSSGC